MKYTEIIVSISILLLVSSLFVFSFTTLNRNCKLIDEMNMDQSKMLKVDLEIRNMVSDITIPYWEPSESYINRFEKTLFNKMLEYDVTVDSVSRIKDSSDLTRGLEIVWTYKGNTHKTKELFSSNPIIK